MTVRELLIAFKRGEFSRAELRRRLQELEAGDRALSEGQQGLWMLQSSQPSAFSYNIPICLRLSGPLDQEALQSALLAVLNAHELLASAIVERDGRPRRTRLDPATLPFASHATGDLSDEQMADVLLARLRMPFALDQGPLIRADLYSRARQEWLLLVVVHHIAFDGGSVGAFMQTLCTAYEHAANGSHAATSEDVGRSFDEFVQWERDVVASDAGQLARRYWLQKLETAKPVLGVGARGGGARRPRTVRRALDGGAEKDIRALCLRLRITPAAFFLSMYQDLLASVSGLDDITVGMAVERRPHEGFDATVGCFVNLVVVRTEFDPAAPLDDRLRRAHSGLAEALAHADYPFQCVARELRQRASGQGQPFDTVFEYKSRRFFSLPAAERHWAGVRFEPVEGLYQEGGYPLAFKVAERESGYVLYFDHDLDQLPEAMADRWLERLAASIEAALPAPADRTTSYQGSSREHAPWRSLHQLICDQARRRPETLAAVHGSEQLTYGELDARSDALAIQLQRAGVGADQVVGLVLERSTDALCALLAVWKSGAAYLALDPELPAERLRFMVEDSGVAVAITRQDLRDLLPGTMEHVVLIGQAPSDVQRAVAPTVDPGQLAYIVYTSGSTGTPKGVAVTHAGLANLARAQADAFGVVAGDRVLQFAPWTFDASVWEIAMALQAGATLYLAPNDSLRRSGQLASLMQKAQINVATLPPSAVTLLEAVELPQLRTLIVAGEECPAALAERWMGRCRFVNAYGPTETTVCATFKFCVPQHSDPAVSADRSSDRLAGTPRSGLGSVAIGGAIRGTTAFVLDPTTLHEIAPGEVGELFVGGIALARGYLHRAALTAERFIANPFGPPGARMYKTGDRVRLLADGELQFVERADRQVKIRGSRVELGEVEAAAQSHPGVAQCAVVLLEERNQLAAFIVPSRGAESLDAQSVRRHIARRLPDYMVPSLVEFQAQLPTNMNGKVDRPALAARWQGTNLKELPGMLGAHETESKVRSIMGQVLRVEEVPLDEGFFDMGGDSILAVSAARRIADAFEIPFDVTALLDLASVRRISAHIAASQTGRATRRAAADSTPKRMSRDPLPSYIDDCVAIIGMSCDVPGARDHRQFWENLRNGVESVEFLDLQTLRSLGVSEDLLERPGLVAARATIPDKDCFDAEFFGVSAQDAQAMDPQLRLLLQHAWKAVEDAGYRPSVIADAGVFMTAANTGYHGDAPPAAWTVMEGSKQYVASAWSQCGSIPTLISHRLGLHGPSLFVHSNCSSSLVALHTAFRSIVAGDAQHALVGAATLSASDTLGYIAERGMNFSSDGHLRPFDEKADGMLGGEGVAVLLLKRASQAVADNDQIYALLRGVAVNNDGAEKAGYYAPSVKGQMQVIDKVLSSTGIDVETIGYVEAHGTATKLGDPLELAALGEAFGRYTQRRQFCGIGSVKSNIGHLDTVAGLAGCIKVALSLKHGEIPASLNYTRPNPAIDLQNSPFYVVGANVPLPKRPGPYRAGVSSFGIGGTNAHALLEEFRPEPRTRAAPTPCLIPLSARKPERLCACAADLLAFLERNGDLDLRDIAYTLQVGREPFACRLALEASTLEELSRGLRDFIAAGPAAADGNGAAAGAALDPDELARLLPYWAASGQWRKVGAAWMAGADIDWEALNAGTGQSRRISLPTYPFGPAKHRRNRRASESDRAPAAAFTLHPLLHHNTSSLTEHRYTTVFDGDEFVFADHCVRGTRLLPGVAYLEMARAALVQATRSALPITLNNVSWLRPLIAASRPVTVHVRIGVLGDGAFSFQVYSEQESTHCLHCEGTATLVAEEPCERMDLAALRSQCTNSVTGDMCYGLFSKLGCDYGPSMRALLETRSGATQEGTRFALGCVRLSADAVRDGRLVLHPGLLDSALQASIGIGLTGSSLDGMELEQTLPFSIDRVRIFRELGEQAWVHVREAAGSSEFVNKLDVRICDEVGRICVELAGLSARIVSEPGANVGGGGGGAESVAPGPIAEAPTADESLGVVPLVPVWECLGPLAAPVATRQLRRVLLVGSVAVLGTSLQEACRDDVLRVADTDHSPADLDALIRSHSPTHVVWIARDAGGLADPETEVMRCLRLAKALLKAGYESRPLHLLAVTMQALPVRNEERGDPAQAAVHGFIGSLAKEYPQWSVHAFDVQDVVRCPWPALLDAVPQPEHSSVALRDGCRYERRLVAAALATDVRTRIVEGGVYVVLGGAGGLGQAWTEYLLRSYRANVVWLGRRPLEGGIAEAVQRLSGLGGSLRYIRADARQRADLEAALKEVEAEHAVVHGIVHTALTLHDRGVMGVEEESFADALSSKVRTATALAGALARYRPADFVLFFSALQSFNPSPGQSSYAAGSAFVDAMATWLRRSGHASARVINWGYWGSVGIVASAAHRRRMEHIGEGSIEPAEAMGFVESTLSGPFDQVAVLKRSAPHGGAALPIINDEMVQVAPAVTGGRFALPDLSLKVAMPDAVSEQANDLDAILASGLSFQIARFSGSWTNPLSLQSLQARLAQPELYGRWLHEALCFLCRAGHMRQLDGGAFAFERRPEDADWAVVEQHLADMQRSDSDRAHARLVGPMLGALPEILAGRCKATDIMFSNASVQRVEDVYKSNPYIDYFNRVVAALVAKYAEQRLRAQPDARLRFLEIGAGTGATSHQVFEALRPVAASVSEYCYTDVSRAFLGHGERAYRNQVPNLRCRLLDIERPLMEQGFDCGQYDVVIATNVLHATRDIHRTLRHAKSALGRNGVLVVNEMSGHELFAHLTFGLLPGWWAYQDAWLREPGSPGLTPATWRRVMEEEGFRSIRFPVGEAHRFGQQIIIAESDGVFRQKSMVMRPSREETNPPNAARALPPAALGDAGAALREEMIGYVCRLVAEALDITVDDVDADEPFESYGIDSILAIRLANALRARFADISSTVIFEYSSASELASYLLSAEAGKRVDNGAAIAMPPGPSEAAQPSPQAGLREAVVAQVRSIVARTLEQPLEEVDVHEPLENYGVDSILAIRVANELRDTFRDVSSTVLFEHRTVTAIADHFIATQPDGARSLLSPAPCENEAAPLPVDASATTVDASAVSVAVPATVSGRAAEEPSLPNPSLQGQERAIAVIGISGRYPQAANVDEFWERLSRGEDCVTEVPAERWPLPGFFEADPGKAIAEGKSYSKWGGFIDGFADFDPLFFGIAPREAMAIDPHERLFLQESWRAFESAGYTRSTLASRHGRRVGVFAGVSQSGFERCASGQDASGDAIHPQTSFGSVANRVSYLLDLQGPSMPIDTMCSSSLTAIHEACEHLLRDECDVAAAGGVNLNLHPSRYVASCEGRFLSTSGRCKSFGEGGDGFVPGEGVGVLILKRLSRAVADGDTIHGVIRATSINHGGKSKGYTAPNPAAQRELVKAAIRKAGISARDISHVEAHGTGTELGDPIEIDALTQAFRDSTMDRGFCTIGSVKSNIGHLEAAAGVAGVTKVLLQLKHKQLAPSLHAERVNPHIAFEASPFRLQRELTPWTVPPGSGSGKRIASVSSFGAGGSNAHVIIEEYIAPARADVAVPGPFLVPLSAKDEARLRDRARQLLDACRTLEDRDLADLAYTQQTAREAMEVRLACVVKSLSELEDKLERFLQDRKDIDEFYSGDTRHGRKSLSWLRNDDDMQALMHTWVARGKHGRLLEAWVNGAVNVDWDLLYPNVRPRRISLPTYPFAQERYWLEALAPSPKPPAGKNGTVERSLHPLVHRNTSTLHGVRFSTSFSGSEPIFADHIVAGQRILPAVAYLEMMRAATTLAAQADNHASMRISDVVWLKPVVAEASPLQLHIHVKRQDAALVCEVRRDDDATGLGTGETHGRAAPFVRANVFLQPQVAPVLDVDTLRASLVGTAMPGEACYRELSAIGVEYGPSHRGLVEIQAGRDADGHFVLARLELPATARADAERFALHPSLLDSAVQAAGFYADGAQGDEKGGASVPFALDSLQLFHVCPSECWAVVRRQPSGVTRTDIDICDVAGRVCVRLEGMTGRTYRHGMSAPAEPRTLFFVPAPQQPKEWLPESGGPRRLVVACDIPATALAGATSLANRTVLESASSDPAERFASYAEQMLAAVQTLQQESAKTPTLLQVVLPRRGVGRLHAALAALLRGAEAESPGLSTQLLALETQAGSSDIEAEVVRVDALREVELPMRDDATVWREGGVYLVTGGLGGIGRAVVAGIGRARKAATVIIAGRSELDDAKREQLRRLAAPGLRVEYRCVDVSHRVQVEELIAETVKHFGSLHGVLHCAGVAHSRAVAELSTTELRRVLAAKVFGARNLDLATRHLSLEFFVLFSSLTTRTGATGQAAYATANAFLNEYAQYRYELQGLGERHGRSLSIAWPYWATDGGMQLPADTVDEMRRYGFAALDGESGMEALTRALAAGHPQLAVAHGDPAKIRGALDTRSALAPMPQPQPKSQPQPQLQPVPIADQTRLTEATAALREFLAQQLMIDPARIHASDMFDTFGIDSVVAVRLTAALEKLYGSLSKTLFFEYSTVADLASYLSTRHRLASPDASGLRGAAVSEAKAVREASEASSDTAAMASAPSTSAASPTRASSDVAIIGLAGRYPRSPTLEALWDNLKAGADCIGEIPPDRWELDHFFEAGKAVPGKSYSKWGGFIDGVADFDPKFFNISPREAPMMDPQERLFLMCAHETLEDAGYTRESLNLSAEAAGGGVGVFVGVMHTEYQLYGAQAQERGEPLVLGSGISSVANRVSYFGNFQGPSLAVDTMCSSSLTAIHLACQSLRDGDCGVAIAGGVNVSLHPNKYLGLSQAQFASSNGRCAAFGEGGDGYVPGEGVGAILLKPLERAVADGDRIYGVIKGTGINHGGRSNGFTVPSATAQARLIGRVIERSGVDPRSIGYVEAHGTGTALGDPIEIAGLTRALGARTRDAQFCAIGSIKSNIGHCESAAGIAGLTKVLLQIKHATLVPTLHAQRLNPNIDFAQTPFLVQRTLEPWPSRTDANGNVMPRTAAISSFGAGGANAHVLVEEFLQPLQRGRADEQPSAYPTLILLSARDGERLALSVQRLLENLSAGAYQETDLEAIGYTLQTGREHYPHRVAFSVRSIAELVRKLEAFVDGDLTGCHCGEVSEDMKAAPELPALDLESLMGGDEEHRILEAWVKGMSLSWERLYAGRRPPRLRLPTYPFARERYWAPESLQGRPMRRSASHLQDVAADEPAVAPARALSISASVAGEAEAASIAAPSTEPALTDTRVVAGELKEIESVLRETLAEALYMNVADVGVHTTFVDLGMDSVMGVEWLPVIRERLGVSLGATKIYEYPTLRELAAYVMSQRPGVALSGSAQLSAERSMDEWLQAIYDGSADPADAQRWLQALDTMPAGAIHVE